MDRGDRIRCMRSGCVSIKPYDHMFKVLVERKGKTKKRYVCPECFIDYEVSLREVIMSVTLPNSKEKVDLLYQEGEDGKDKKKYGYKKYILDDIRRQYYARNPIL